MDLPTRAQVVVVGGGVVGVSVAYHLARGGVTDVLLLERDRLTSGTTWHAAGLMAQLRASETLTRLASRSLELYGRLEEETGQATGLRRTGAITVASSDGRMEELTRATTLARRMGVEAHLIGPDETVDLFPVLDRRDLRGGLWLPNEGVCNAVDATMALAAGARQNGARILERVPVTGLIERRGRCVGVSTEQGDIEADTVVLAAGMWSREIASRHGVTVPLQAAEHYYVVTEPLPELPSELPYVRDPDRYAYFKPEGKGLLVGLFEPVAKPWGVDGIPRNFSFGRIEPDLEHLQPLLENAFERAPLLHDRGLRLLFAGPESFTCDDRCVLGEAPSLPGLFVAAGFNSIGLQLAGGVGEALAGWIVDGHPAMDLLELDITRFHPFQATRSYLRERTVETLGLPYQIHWPFFQNRTARGIRHSPLHARLAENGAVFGELAGWERANWFAGDGPAEYEYSFGRQNWFERNRIEHEAVRQTVGLFDQTSFAKLLVQGPDAESALNRVVANNVAVPVGRIVYTQALNERAGIEADVTITRLDEESFMIVTPPTSQLKDFHYFRSHLRDSRTVVTDVTSAFATIALMGPRSRELLSCLTDTPLGNESFPFSTSQEMQLGPAIVRALRVTYVGELGWELYVPTEFACVVFDQLMSVGRDFDLRLCGYHTMNSCRLEKGYRHFGHDMGPEDSPLEAGLGFAVAWGKAGFIGREALERQRSEGVRRRLLHFAVRDPEAMLHHEELIYRSGERVGYVTSAMWGHTVDAVVALGYVDLPDHGDEDFLAGGDWEIDAGRRRFAAEVSAKPFYDPASLAVKAIETGEAVAATT